MDLLGPSDSSDSGSDIQGEPWMDQAPADAERLGAARTEHGSDTDAAGTGERGSALPDEDVRDGADIAPDRIGRFDVNASDEELDDSDIDALSADEPFDEEETSTDR